MIKYIFKELEMKNAIIFHGGGSSNNSFWYPYLKKELVKRGYRVWLPYLQSQDDLDLKKFLPWVLKNGKFTRETVIIAHSDGCPLTLAVLEKINIKIKQAILVAGYATPLSPPVTNKTLKAHYDWQRIKSNVKEIVFIHSDNDPWGCDIKQGKYLFKKLGGTLIIRHGEGHMGSSKFNQPYKKFPLIIPLIENKLWG